MSQSGNRRTDRGSAEQSSRPKRRSGSVPTRRTAIILTAVVILVILAIVGAFAYPTYIAPFRISVITGENIDIKMDYFIKRIKLSGSDPIAMITQLTNDQVIKLGAPNLGISVTQQDLDETMRAMFESGSSGNGTATDAEYKEWYRQLLNESGLTDAEYREIVTIELLRSRLQEYLAVRMPTVAEQVHLNGIFVEKLKDAEDIRARWAAGEKFGDLAKTFSLDSQIAAKGGEIGWFPQGGALPANFEYEAFNLTSGNVSEPLPEIQDQQQPDGSSAPTIIGYHLLMVSERAERELDANSLQILRGKVVDNWVSEERTKYNMKWHGLNNGFDSETYAWINYQIAKSKASGSSSSNQQK